MNKRIFRILSTCAALLFAITAQTGWAQSDDHGRISYSTDDALVLGEGEDEWSFAGINTLILEGDRVWADDSGAIELEFPAGYYIRLADGSEVEILSLPPEGLIRGWVGSFYVQRLDRSAGDLTFDTGAAQYTLDPGTVARFDVLTDGATTLSVHDGRVSVFTDDGQVMDIGRGYRTYIDPGLLPSSPERFRASDDTFDVWNNTRVSYLADYSEPEPIRSTRSAAPIGVRDLGNYGEWVYVDRSYYWRPTYITTYVPYRHGYWSYVPRHGYVWVGHYPFDYVTAHYGYWQYNSYYGWLWSYEPVYAPARVVSIYYGDVLFWAPATRYGYPVYGSHFDFALGGFRFSLAFTSFAYKHHVFKHHHYHDYYYAQPLHRHVINSQPRSARPYLWDHHRRRDLDYWEAVHRNTTIGEWRDEPAQRVRGFTESDRRGEARAVAANLQERRGRAEFRTDAASRRTVTGARTSTLAGQRVARARDIESITDRGMRVSPPVDRAPERTQRTETRTPVPDRGADRGIRVDRSPVTREQVTRGDRGVVTQTRREVRTLPTDRGLDRRERAEVDTRRQERALPSDRGIDRIQVPDRRDSVRVDRSPADRGITRTAPSDRMQTRDARSSAGTQGAARSGRTLDPSRGLDRSQVVGVDRSQLSAGTRTRTQIIRPDPGSREIVRTPTVQRSDRYSTPSRVPTASESTRGMNYRSAPPAPTTRSIPAPTRSRDVSRGTSAPSRAAPVAPSTRGNAPAAPSSRSVAPSAPASRGVDRGGVSRSDMGSRTRR